MLQFKLCCMHQVDQLDLLIGASAEDPDDITHASGEDPSLLQGSSGVGNSYVVNLAKMLDIHEVGRDGGRWERRGRLWSGIPAPTKLFTNFFSFGAKSMG